MRVRLKGLNSRKKRLADGREVTYWWAWKGGPALPGKPGSPEFMAAYNEAVSRKRTAPAGSLQSIFNGYQAAGEWKLLAARTQRDYVKIIKKLEAEFGDFPLTAMSDRRTRGEFLAWRDRVAAASGSRQGDYQFTVLAAILSWAFNRGLITTNPCTKAGRLYRGTRVDKVWSDTDEASFLAKAPRHLHLAMLLALWTGQREGDLLRLTWFNYDGKFIRLTQQKTVRRKQGNAGTRVVIPAGAPLRAALDALPRTAGPILLTQRGKPWTEGGFGASFRKAQAKAGISGVTFNDMRGTAVTRLALAGASVPEIATFTGHSLKDVQSILDAHYLNRDPAMAESALEKLETRTKIPD